MKFAKYLHDTQTPEWEKAYIDYHALKVQLSAIRTKAPQQASTLRSFGKEDIDYIHHSASNDEEKYNESKGPYLNRENRISAMRWRTSNQQMPSFSSTLAGLPSRSTKTSLNTPPQQIPTQSPTSHPPPPINPPFGDSTSPTLSPFRAMLSNLPANHAKFFDMLDAELYRIETFYLEREEEMHERAKLLRKQLGELGRHRQLFYETSAHSKAQGWAKKTYISVVSILSLMTLRFSSGNTRLEEPHQTRRNGVSASESGRGMHGSEHKGLNDNHYGSRRKDRLAKDTEKYSGTVVSPKAVDGFNRSPPKRSNGFSNSSSDTTGPLLNPQEYEHAKRRLRKAVVEHYRGLEVLNDYRVLNLTGFRKALRKYGKITKIPVLDAYMREKVEPSVFASGAMVSTMLKEMEHLFAIRFERGNKKKALNHLRVRPPSTTHHFSTFRSGLWLGLAFSAAAGGCYLSFQEQTRGLLPSWNILLFIYSILFLPVFLALLIGTNIFVWMHSKINYVFIFKLNQRSRLDYREYFELPSFFLCTLAYAFWFSLARIGPPTLWPLAWLVLNFVVMANPIRSFMWGQARWWTIRKVVKLGASGLWTVEFADLWLGDQFCSLVYSLGNLYFVGCFYSHSFVDSSKFIVQPVSPSSNASTHVSVTALNQASSSVLQTLLPSGYDPQEQQAWTTCGVSQNWGWYYLLGVLPFLARFLQSLRRYWDSKLFSQLINAGKYGVGMIQSFFYFYWRHHMSPHTGKSYILFCFAATANSLYGCAWDFFVDWSMCKPYSKYPLLRPQLVYKSQISLYYLAMLANLCIRFNWLIYIFFDEGNIELFSFVVAMTEMLRRAQWNFYRVENKHLSNMDLYRATREPPLPYYFDVQSNGAEEHAAQLRLRKRIARLS